MRHERQDKQIKAHHKQPPRTTGADHLPPVCHTPRAARLRALKCENMLEQQLERELYRIPETEWWLQGEIA